MFVPETREHIVTAVGGQHTLKKIVEVVLIPQKYVRRVVEEIVDTMFGVIKGFPQERGYESWSTLWIRQLQIS